MSNSMNSRRRIAAGAIGAGTVAGALLVGTAGPAQAVPEVVSGPPPAAVQVSDSVFDAPAVIGGQLATDRAPGTVFATDWHAAPIPQWGWWRHHHRWWHHWWWWW